MRPASQKPSFGHDLVEAMKLISAHLRGQIELEQVWPKPHRPNSIRKPNRTDARRRSRR